MIKQMHGWKVLSRDRTSVTHSHFSIIYPINVQVFPILEHSKLFFFAKKEDADAFVTYQGLFFTSVVPCIAYNCSRIISISRVFEHLIEEFWKLKHSKKNVNVVNNYNQFISKLSPKGSWVAESIKCLE